MERIIIDHVELDTTGRIVMGGIAFVGATVMVLLFVWLFRRKRTSQAPKRLRFRSVVWSNALIVFLAGPSMALLFYGIGWIVGRPHPKDVVFLLVRCVIVGLVVGTSASLCYLGYSGAIHVRREWFRGRLRWLLLVVAIVVVITFVLGRRADSLRKHSEEHLMKAVTFLTVVDGIDRLPTRNAQQEALRNQFQAKFDYHANLSLKYEQAIWRPWLAPEEDGPPP